MDREQENSIGKLHVPFTNWYEMDGWLEGVRFTEFGLVHIYNQGGDKEGFPLTVLDFINTRNNKRYKRTFTESLTKRQITVEIGKFVEWAVNNHAHLISKGAN